jgi:tetratricopeptide (TPR) repeat protein
MLLESLQDVGVLSEAEQLLVDGKWRKAERLCFEILAQGDQPRAAFVLGQVYVALGQSKRALEYFRKAADWDPQNAPAHFSCAELAQAQGDFQTAAQAWINGLEIDPAHLPAHLGLSGALLSLGLPAAAMIAAKQALLVDAESSEAWKRVAQAAELAGDVSETIQALKKCHLLKPGSADPLRRLAILHQCQGEFEQSQGLLARAIDLEPRNAGLRFEFSQILAKVGSRAAAMRELREALRVQPHFPEALSNLGMLLRADQRLDEAEVAYKKACSQRPNFALAWNNLANLHIERVRLDEAERCYSKAIAIAPDYAEAHTGRAMLRLLKGRFREGWDEYEWRWSQPGQQRREFGCPEWDGSALNGRTILLHAEQGAGDTIQFIRYAKLLKRRGARVVLHCPSSLRPVMEEMPEVDQVVCGKESLPAFDVHAPLMSLPRLFGTDLTNLPGDTPYLTVSGGVNVPEALLTGGDTLRIGLAWAGNPNHHNDRNRSIPSTLLQPLLRIEGARFFSLQLGGEPLVASANGAPLVDLGPFLSSYGVTAACLQRLDLLITVDTSVAHLAGALGRPVWMLVPVCNDWRWLLHRSDSPWYPSMRLFRQRRLGDWSEVLKQIEGECSALVSGNR